VPTASAAGIRTSAVPERSLGHAGSHPRAPAGAL